MQVYNYSPQNGVYIGVSEADESPLEPGVFLVPAHATTIEPPSTSPTHHAVWVDGVWQVQPIPAPPGPALPPEAGEGEVVAWTNDGWDVVAAPDYPQPEVAAPPTDPGPDYKMLLTQLLVSDVYQAIIMQSTTNAVVNTALTLIMGNLLLASEGRSNLVNLQGAVDLLFTGFHAIPEHYEELDDVLTATGLTDLITIEPVPGPPRYDVFLATFMASPLYAKLQVQSAASLQVNVLFTSAIGLVILATSGHPDVPALERAFNELVAAITLEEGDLEVFAVILAAAHLDNLITIVPPD